MNISSLPLAVGGLFGFGFLPGLGPLPGFGLLPWLPPPEQLEPSPLHTPQRSVFALEAIAPSHPTVCRNKRPHLLLLIKEIFSTLSKDVSVMY